MFPSMEDRHPRHPRRPPRLPAEAAEEREKHPQHLSHSWVLPAAAAMLVEERLAAGAVARASPCQVETEAQEDHDRRRSLRWAEVEPSYS